MRDIKKYLFGIPAGWKKLFHQMYEDLAAVQLPEDYDFLQIETNCGCLICHPNKRIPKADEIIKNYQYLSHFVCAGCGQPATCYTMSGYIAPFCDECWRDWGRHSATKFFKDPIQLTRKNYSVWDENFIEVSVEDEWNRYIKSI